MQIDIQILSPTLSCQGKKMSHALNVCTVTQHLHSVQAPDLADLWWTVTDPPTFLQSNNFIGSFSLSLFFLANPEFNSWSSGPVFLVSFKLRQFQAFVFHETVILEKRRPMQTSTDFSNSIFMLRCRFCSFWQKNYKHNFLLNASQRHSGSVCFVISDNSDPLVRVEYTWFLH